MTNHQIPDWLRWARELQAIAQNGLHFGHSPFDIERYERIREIAAEIMSTNSAAPIEPVLHLFSEQTGYATPKVDVRGVVFREYRILMVKEKLDGGWTLPGGWADPNESPGEAVEREVHEESGFVVRAEKLLAVYDRDKQGHTPAYPFQVYKVFIRCKLIGGRSTTSLETEEVAFFTHSETRQLDLSVSRTTQRQIDRFFEHLEHPDWPTEFD